MIKWIGLITMALDHVGILYFPNIIIFRIIGRLAFPIFAWGIAKGYRQTRNLNNYLIRLFLLGAASQVPYTLLFKSYNLNICFTLLNGLIILIIFEKKISLWIRSTSIGGLLLLTQYLNFDYGIYGLITIFIFYYYGDSDKTILYQGAATLLSIIIFKYDPIQLFAIFSPLIISTLIHKDFKINKTFQYSFYPLHLLILLILQ